VKKFWWFKPIFGSLWFVCYREPKVAFFWTPDGALICTWHGGYVVLPYPESWPTGPNWKGSR